MKKIVSFIFISALLFSKNTFAQTSFIKQHESVEETVETFESPLLINNQTIKSLAKNELEISYIQRFGLIKNDADMFGIYSPSNVRLGVDYGILNKLTIGAGATAYKHIFDANIKYIFLQQSSSMPVSIGYFGELSRNGSDQSVLVNQAGEFNSINRISYFHEMMISRKFNEKFSLQAAFTLSYLNLVEPEKVNANYGISFIGKYELSKYASFIFDFDYPVTQPNVNPQKPNIGAGFEFKGKQNIFQLFVTTTNIIVNDEMRIYNQNDILKKEFLIGFNISKNWNFRKKD